MNRRSLLRGTAASGIGPVSARTVRSRSDGERPVADGSGVIVRLADVTDPIDGGDSLEWTAELENATDRSVRPTVEYTVDGEPAGAVTLTLGPGETERPFSGNRRVEPAAEDREVSLRVTAAGDSAERTVTVLGVDELEAERSRPAEDLAVRPGTTVLFEAGAVDPNASQFTSWWANGDRVGDSMVGPAWQSIYYAERHAHYWQYTAESAGRHEITAGIDTDVGNYRVDWTVNVTPDGRPSPTIDDARPEPGRLPVDRAEPTALEVDVADPDGRLERVVWWLGQADQIIGTSEISGTTDTVSLTVEEGLCQTCPIIVWVICTDGRFTSESLWEVDVTADGTGTG
ncbi:hypothetical protein [Natrinema salsiterrestre]|uniref:Uncharacterized protein n=1 Tax=Natrinema salsiterrestre TaxID=2950540 RepID=A0A9Q4L2H8_9EURY|nr:hypothetical protein [Natrinema salsiterrestre]MDF9746424.1 hypothetical protein [Natrinema salsiterrestre]